MKGLTPTSAIHINAPNLPISVVLSQKSNEPSLITVQQFMHTCPDEPSASDSQDWVVLEILNKNPTDLFEIRGEAILERSAAIELKAQRATASDRVSTVESFKEINLRLKTSLDVSKFVANKNRILAGAGARLAQGQSGTMPLLLNPSGVIGPFAKEGQRVVIKALYVDSNGKIKEFESTVVAQPSSLVGCKLIGI